MLFLKIPLSYFTQLLSILHWRQNLPHVPLHLLVLIKSLVLSPAAGLLVPKCILPVAWESWARKTCCPFVINWHTATIDYRTWQCLFRRNLSPVTSLPRLQQGQRTHRKPINTILSASRSLSGTGKRKRRKTAWVQRLVGVEDMSGTVRGKQIETNEPKKKKRQRWQMD